MYVLYTVEVRIQVLQCIHLVLVGVPLGMTLNAKDMLSRMDSSLSPMCCLLGDCLGVCIVIPGFGCGLACFDGFVVDVR